MDQGMYNALTSRGPTANLWRGFDFSAIDSDPGIGNHVWNEFDGAGYLPAPAAAYNQPFGNCDLFCDGTTVGNQIIGGSGGPGSSVINTTTPRLSALGVFTIDSAGTAVDNEATVLTQNSGLILNSGTRLAAMEARIRVSTITTALREIFIGLIGSNVSPTTIIPLTTTDDLLDTECGLIGFHGLASGALMDFKFDQVSQTAVTHLASAATLVVDAWIKLGIRYDRVYESNSARRVSIWVDGAPLTTYITDTLATGATFPKSVGMNLCLAVKARSTTDYGTVQMDWWRAAQVF